MQIDFDNFIYGGSEVLKSGRSFSHIVLLLDAWRFYYLERVDGSCTGWEEALGGAGFPWDWGAGPRGWGGSGKARGGRSPFLKALLARAFGKRSNEMGRNNKGNSGSGNFENELFQVQIHVREHLQRLVRDEHGTIP